MEPLDATPGATTEAVAERPATPPIPWTPIVEGVVLDPIAQGRALLERGLIDEAIAELSIAAAVGPNWAEANNLLGLAYDRKGMHERAREAYERALSLMPNGARIINNIGFSYYLSGDYRLAHDYLRRAARMARNDPVILQNLALAQGRLGKFGDAYRNLARSVGEFTARLRVAEMLTAAGRLSEAIRHYEAALRLQPNSAVVLQNLSALYQRTGRHRDAARRLTNGQPPE